MKGIHAKHFPFIISLSLVVIASFFTYFYRYHHPDGIYWDENFHITSGEKYIQGIYFHESHPPAGKLFIALGEKLIDPNRNIDKSRLITTDCIEFELPEKFSFAGYRFFPALMAFLSAPLLFLSFYKICNRPFFALVFTSFFIFDNALIVHCRGAMLEGPQIFFLSLSILFFLNTFYRDKVDKKYLIILLLCGFFAGISTMAKLTSLILIFQFVALAFKIKKIKTILKCGAIYATGFILAVIFIWQIHFALGKRFSTEKRYGTTIETIRLIESGQSGALINFPRLFWEANKYIMTDNLSSGGLDMCDPDELGSPFYFWPFGGRSINYRWETDDEVGYRYLYLQCNPIVWYTGIFSIILAAALSIARVVSNFRFSSYQNEILINLFLSMYSCYMIAIAVIESNQVMYLYHYLIPLIFTFFLFALCIFEIQTIYGWKITEMHRRKTLQVVLCLVIATFAYYSPLTFFHPLLDEQVESRSIISLWGLKTTSEMNEGNEEDEDENDEDVDSSDIER